MISRQYFYRRMPMKRLVFLILMVFCVPFVVFFIWYNAHAINIINDRIAENTKSKISYYQDSSESMLEYIEGFMINTVANDANFRQLEFKLSELDAHLNSYEILQKYQNMMTLNPVLRAMFIYTIKNDLYRKIYTYNFPFRDKEVIDEYIKNRILSQKTDMKKWTVEKIGEKYYLLRILGINNTYCISLVDFDVLYRMENLQAFPEEHLFYADDTMQPLTDLEILFRKKITIQKLHPGDKYSILDGDRRYFFVSTYSKYLHMYLISCSPYYGLLKNMDRFQFILLVVSVLFMFLIGLCFVLLNHLLIFPLDMFVRTMTKIKEGQISSRLRMPEYILEFSQIGTVFNGMMDEITKLKIEKYEQQMELQKVELQRLQIQIRPHFYLNCLKVFYGMAEQKQYRKIQEMILSLSGYLRALFKNRDFTVSIDDELSSVEKYMDFQQRSADIPPVLVMSIAENVREFQIPSMSVLTFVENSLKYAQIPGDILRVRITAKKLESVGESCINITIADNGPGFSEESLAKLNAGKFDENSPDRIGIMNIRRRLAILYGNKFEMIFLNRHGACIELFIQSEGIIPRGLPQGY
jgi:two-component system, sensor histidine kinase YesM